MAHTPEELARLQQCYADDVRIEWFGKREKWCWRIPRLRGIGNQRRAGKTMLASGFDSPIAAADDYLKRKK